MPDLMIVIATILLIALIMGVFALGRSEGVRERSDRDISDFVKQNWPDQWAAYERGVQEGYAAGIADAHVFPGKEPPDEPA